MNKKPKILIVDDKPENLYALESVLKNMDVEIIKAQSGNEALLKAIKYKFALAIIDIQMPEMDGYELAEIMMEEDSTKDIPIIFLSAIYSDEFHIFKGYETGIVDFITKPYKPEVLLSKVKVFVKLENQKNRLNELVYDLKKHEDHLQELVEEKTNELNETTAQLVQSSKLAALGEISAGVAHELNQPLNGIKIIAQSLVSDIRKNRLEIDDLNNDLKEIINQVNRMAEIIDHMRRFSRFSDTDMMEPTDINIVIKDPLKLVQQQLKNHNIEVKKELSSDLPKIMGNSIRLGQVFLNLITNAKHALDNCQKSDKKIEIKTYVNAIGQLSDGGAFIVAEVKDNANGIPENLQEKIFQPFFTTKEAGKGTGLGLSITNRIIQEHKGRIELKSEVGIGTAFRILLPVKVS